MKRFYLVFAIALAVAGGAWAGEGDYDIRQMQDRLAAQEARMAEQDARMNDLQAKVASGMGLGRASEEGNTADNVLSLRKNAKVTVGGLMTTKFQYTGGKIDSVYDDAGQNTLPMGKRAEVRGSDLAITDAEVHLQVDVNDHFDAFINIDLQNNASDYYMAKQYYVRWKNICDTGFGLKVGRDALVFGDEGFGYLASYAASGGDGLSETPSEFQRHSGFYAPAFDDDGNFTNALAANGSLIPLHNGWDVSGVTQITPYWEGLDGKLKLELSLMQNIYEDTPYANWTESGAYYVRNSNDMSKVRSRNYGFGTASFRATYEPIENLKFTASVANYRSNGSSGPDGAGSLTGYELDNYMSKNNSVFGLAASYRPACFDKLFVWAQYIHGNNVYFYRGMKSDVVNFGFAYDLTERMTFFAQGDYLRTSYDYKGGDFAGVNNQVGKAWSFYTGLQYSFDYGVSLELGWKHEKIWYKQNGSTIVKGKGDSLYALLGFEF